ncbi:AAA family ATPase [Rhodanobacter ginsengisoli]|uniref:AAA family ATPase n=1 Tax=Rhodanobacter ginsengisoli TaxID=418646 RepID=A0ABW0QMX2_9GAMM
MDTFDQWMAERDAWLQTAAADLLEHGKPSATQIAQLADYCIMEEQKKAFAAKQFPSGTFSTDQTGKVLRLLGVRDLQGINALDPAAKLDFGDADITIVYGPNGCGKSGFARLLKLATGSRKNTPILRDINSNAEVDQQAVFEIAENGNSLTQTWTALSGPLAKLKQVHVYDSVVARSYLVDKEEATYEPRRLRFLSALSDVCDQVRDELRDRESKLLSKLPTIPAHLSQSKLASVLSTLRVSETHESFKKKVIKKKDHEERRARLQDAVKTADPSARLLQIAASLKVVEGGAAKLKSFEEALSKASISKVLDSQKKSLDARKAADDLAKSTLTGSSLEGVGGSTWKIMWEAARAFSVTLSPVPLAFPPTEGDPCPLCQACISKETESRLAAFEAFVKGEVESNAKAAEQEHADLIKKLPALPAEAEWLAMFPVGEQVVASVFAIIKGALEKAGASNFEALKEGIDRVGIASLHQELEAYKSRLLEERELLNAASDAEGLAKLLGELSELQMVDWCHDNLQAILDELDRIKRIDLIKKASKRTNTAEITKKKTALAKEELVGGYQDRFVKELKFFGANRIAVKPNETSGAKGKVKFVLNIAGAEKASLEEVLSEGEARVVSLSNFLADTSISPITSPFIFDDPVSSLDIEFEERVAQRLIELAKIRQVIVFTHRLSLACILRDAYKRYAATQKSTGDGKAISLREVVLCRIEKRIGLTAGLNTLSGSIPQGLESLLSRVKQAKVKEEGGDYAGYQSDVKSICSDMRMLCERSVEEVLLLGIVTRFKRGINTKDKLHPLTKISPEDCSFVDDLMTKYSVYEHSQSSELPSTPPALDELKGDIEALKSWSAEFKKRTAT